MSENKERSAFPEVYLDIEVKDKDGKVIHKHKEKARSWTRNFILFLRYGFAGTNITLIDQGGSAVTKTPDGTIHDMMFVTAGNNDSSFGIMVGTDSTPYSVNNYALGNKIQSGGFYYQSTVVEDITDTGTALYFGIARTFLNGSGSPVTVTEVGLAMWFENAPALIARDVLSTPVTVPVGGSLTVRYVITFQYA